MRDNENLADTLDLTPRRSVWLADEERTTIRQGIEEVFASSGNLSPEHSYLLQQALSELHVAAARGAYYPGVDETARAADGRDSGSEPVRLSDSETRALLSCVSLPDAVADTLREQGLAGEGTA